VDKNYIPGHVICAKLQTFASVCDQSRLNVLGALGPPGWWAPIIPMTHVEGWGP